MKKKSQFVVKLYEVTSVLTKDMSMEQLTIFITPLTDFLNKTNTMLNFIRHVWLFLLYITLIPNFKYYKWNGFYFKFFTVIFHLTDGFLGLLWPLRQLNICLSLLPRVPP